MTLPALYQFLLLIVVATLLVLPMSWFIATVFADHPPAAPTGAHKRMAWLEKPLFAITGIRNEIEQKWTSYLGSLLAFNALGFVVLFLILTFQNVLPHNPQHLPGLDAPLAFNIAASFITNTNWQSYSGETTLSQFSQMMGLTVQNFLSAATGLAVAIAMIRGFTRRETPLIGNFWADVTRATLYILLPLALVFAVFLMTQGVPDNLHAPVQATTLEGAAQTIPQGPVASQIAIKMLGSNGGGYFNANGAHPYENPTPLSNFFQLISIILIPAALVFSFGRLVGDKRQGRALFICMSLLFIILFALCLDAESGGNPALTALGVDQVASDTNIGGNMEGKEVRFGIFNSALWATLTTATSNGSVIASHESLLPVSAFVALFNMLVGEVIYGGIGCGLYGMLIYVLITVFVAGLMVGRTPEYLGKKIEAHEIKLAVISQLLYPVCVLGFGMVSLLSKAGAASMSTGGAHGLTQTLYAYASAAANNGSAFAGFNGNTDYQNIALGIVMLIGRFGVIAPVLAIAGSLAMKRATPPSSGTFPTHGGMFILMLFAVIVMFGGLTYFPALALGPIAEHLALFHAVVPAALPAALPAVGVQ